MQFRRWFIRALLAVTVLPAFAEGAIAQTAQAGPGTSEIPRTLDGHPDMQGVWDNRWRTFLERQPGVAVGALDAAGARQLEEQQAAQFRQLPGNGNPESDQDMTTLVPVRGEYRTSLIIDPANGRVPWRPDARPIPRDLINGAVNGPEERAPSERCIATPSFPLLPLPSNGYIQIIQPPGLVLMRPEALSDLRLLVPGRTGSQETVSRWEGDNLVVETRSFAPETHWVIPMTLVGFGPATSVRETFTPVSPDEILYRFTVTDETLYSQPWTVETTWVRSPNPVLEYACHEGNYALSNILMGGRVRDAQREGASR
jgi:hypothetical protein